MTQDPALEVQNVSFGLGWLTELAMIVLFRIYFFMNKIANWSSYSEFSLLIWLFYCG